MTSEELKFIKLNGINPHDNHPKAPRKELFDKLTAEYKQAFLKKFGEGVVVDGVEVFSYDGELYIYCAPFGDGQYSGNFTFGVGSQSERYGKYDEHAGSTKMISIPCLMCTQETAKIFPVIKVEFKIIEGKIKYIPAKVPTIITSRGKTQLAEDERIKVFDESIIISDLGFRSAKTGELLIKNNARFKSYNRENESIRTSNYVTDPNPKYYSIEKLTAVLNGDKIVKHEDRVEKSL